MGCVVCTRVGLRNLPAEQISQTAPPAGFRIQWGRPSHHPFSARLRQPGGACRSQNQRARCRPSLPAEGPGGYLFSLTLLYDVFLIYHFYVLFFTKQKADGRQPFWGEVQPEGGGSHSRTVAPHSRPVTPHSRPLVPRVSRAISQHIHSVWRQPTLSHRSGVHNLKVMEHLAAQV